MTTIGTSKKNPETFDIASIFFLYQNNFDDNRQCNLLVAVRKKIKK
jgi:hypothetical protein